MLVTRVFCLLHVFFARVFCLLHVFFLFVAHVFCLLHVFFVCCTCLLHVARACCMNLSFNKSSHTRVLKLDFMFTVNRYKIGLNANKLNKIG